MELALSLGDTPKGVSSFLGKLEKMGNKADDHHLGFCMGLGKKTSEAENRKEETINRNKGEDPLPLQLDLLPFSPLPMNQTSSNLRFPWLSENLAAEPRSATGPGLNRRSSMVEEGDEGASLSSPNSVVSSFQMDYSMYRGGVKGKRFFEATVAVTNEGDIDRYGCSRASDEEENGGARKKLRLTKEQSAFLEESFKEHHSLNPKQKLALAKQLNLRPRQVEVWFQNRRARTKLKQTEVDCEYLKRCCDALTEENRRLQKELQELRALKTSQPFYMQLPATTLTMCPSCERTVSNANSSPVTATATATATATTTTAVTTTEIANTTLSLAKPTSFPFSPSQFQASQVAK